MKLIKVLCLILAFAPIIIEYDNVSPSDMTPLHRAAGDGDIEQVKNLISGGIYINAQNMVGNTPLHLAAQNGHRHIIELLLAGNADVNIKNMSGRTPLHYAAQRGHMEASEFLITKGALVDARNNSGGTPLHYAANAGHKDMVELLLAHGADINAQGQSGGTPLHGAVINGRKDVIELLVLKGADVNIKDRGGSTPLSEAVQLHDKEVAEFLVVKGAVVEYVIDKLLKTDLKPLLKAAKDGDFDSVKSLISNGANVNIKDWQSKTPLHHAVEAGHIEIVGLLLAKGARVNAKDAWNCETPLHMAVRIHRRDIAEILISNGADVNAKKQLDDTPLLIAALAGPEYLEKHLSMEDDDVTTDTAVYLRELQKFKSLLENETKIDSRDLTDATPLHLAILDGHIELSELLIAEGANVNAKCKFGETPLHFAAAGAHKEIVELLLAKGADINATDYQRQSPLKWAKDKGHTEIVELLRKHGAKDPSKVDTIKSGRFNDVADLALTGEMPGPQQFGNYLRHGDVNGDGCDDLLVAGASRYNNCQGRVYLYYGGTNMDDKPDKVFTGEMPGDYFGEGAFLLDLNGDDFADVIVGAPGYNSIQGRVYLYYGGPDFDTTADKVFDGEKETTGRFGRMIAAGDINNDGYAEIVVCADYLNLKKGRVYLYYGAPGTGMDTVCDLVFDGENPNDRFGIPLTLGQDIDGDSYGDLLIGSAFYPHGNSDGRCYLHWGAKGTGMDNISDLIFNNRSEGEQFATCINLFDIDNDGYADVLISAREWGEAPNASQGRAYIYWGSSRDTMDNVADVTFTGEAFTNASFGGNTIYAGHVNNDPYGDIIISAYNWHQRNRIGRTYLFHGGTKASIDTKCDHIFSENKKPNTNYGKEARLCDLNNDGLDDVVLGGWSYNNSQGRVWIYFNNPPSSK